MRKAKVEESLLAPGRKSRHEKCDLAHLIKKSEESYVDFKEAAIR